MIGYAGILLCLAFWATAAEWHVRVEGDDSNDGSSWERALASPQVAMERAEKGDEIRIAGGTYRASFLRPAGLGGAFAASFVLKDGVHLKGGYRGRGGRPDERPRVEGGALWEFSNPSIFTISEKMPGCVLLAGREAPIQELSIIDGISFTGGSALGAGQDGYGGGLFVNGRVCLRNCRLVNNTARMGGGAYLTGGAVLDTCLVEGNQVLEEGWKGRGGGIYIGSHARVKTCLIACNGQGVQEGGGIYAEGMGCVSACTIVANTAERNAPGVCMPSAEATLENTVVWGNTGGGIQVVLGGRLLHCALQGMPLSDTCIPLSEHNAPPGEAMHSDAGRMAFSPAFIAPQKGDWRLAPGSYLINRAAPGSAVTDARGAPRAQCGLPDIGAFESAYPGNLSGDFTVEAPCIYGELSKLDFLPAVLSPDGLAPVFFELNEAALCYTSGKEHYAYWTGPASLHLVLYLPSPDIKVWNDQLVIKSLKPAPRYLMLSADDTECFSDSPPPDFTYSVIAGSLAYGDTLEGRPSAVPNASRNVPVPITRGDVHIAGNEGGYTIDFLNGELISQ